MNCDFSIISNEIKCEKKYGRLEGSFLIKDCILEIDKHMEALKVSKNEFDLKEKDIIILRTFGSIEFECDEFSLTPKVIVAHSKFDNLKICPAHRTKLGIGFRTYSCSNPAHDIIKSYSIKKYLNVENGIKLLKIRKYVDPAIGFIPIGAGLCHDCYSKVSQLKFDDEIFWRIIAPESSNLQNNLSNSMSIG
jgi:hypothetical protein